MAFYLRKHFNSGPLRLNLSKGGLGLSGGIKGARVGLSRRGAYVHGGRQGLYYRKYAKKGRGGQRPAGRGEEVRYFVDTGLTYRKGSGEAAPQEVGAPALPDKGSLMTPLVLLGVLMILVWIYNNHWVFVLPAVIFFAGAYLDKQKHEKYRQEARKLFRAIDGGLEEKQDVPALLERHQQASLPVAYRRWLDHQVMALFLDAYFEDPDYILPEELRQLEARVGVPRNDREQMKAEAFGSFLDAVMEDHVISREEEEQLRRLQEDLAIDDARIARELELIDRMCRFREAMEAPMEPVDVDIRLKNNEVCYHHTRGRLLREKIMRSYQRQGVRYKEIGYDTDMEGDIYLCDKRLLIVDSGSRSYRLNRVLDVTLSVEDHTVQLTLDGRKSPLIFTMEDIGVFAGKLEKVLE